MYDSNIFQKYDFRKRFGWPTNYLKNSQHMLCHYQLTWILLILSFFGGNTNDVEALLKEDKNVLDQLILEW